MVPQKNTAMVEGAKKKYVDSKKDEDRRWMWFFIIMVPITAFILVMYGWHGWKTARTLFWISCGLRCALGIKFE